MTVGDTGADAGDEDEDTLGRLQAGTCSRQSPVGLRLLVPP